VTGNKNNELRINEKINVKEVRLIGAKGEQVGVIQTDKALKMAREESLDLVEVAPNANPPVCRLLDYGKYRFEMEKKTKESKKKQTQIKMKEIRMQPKIDTHDLDFKSKHIKDFLDDGNKVKVTVRFRGREMAHTELGVVVLEKVLELLADNYVVEKKPSMEGRFMSMLLSPKTNKK
jgi:translation initiation factor IF-3